MEALRARVIGLIKPMNDPSLLATAERVKSLDGLEFVVEMAIEEMNGTGDSIKPPSGPLPLDEQQCLSGLITILSEIRKEMAK